MSNSTQVDYPAVKEVCELFDVTVLTDQGVMSQPVYAIGWHGEPDAGIRYGTVTDFFDSMGALEAFCQKHIERFREESKKCDEGAPIPDASDWQ